VNKELDRELIGRRFKAQRIKLGFSKQIDMINDFKEKTGIELKKGAVSMYEKGERLPEHDLLSIFADYFGVTLDYMYGKSDIELDVVKSSLRSLSLLFDGLSDNDKEQAIKYMEYLNFAKKG
jgi:transcriptional regulator with XRE-family HTH domain